MPLLRRPDLWLPPLALMGLIYFLSAQPSLDSGLGWVDDVGRKLVHFGSYALLCALWWRLLRGAGIERRRAALLAFAASSLYAVSDELHQIHGRGPARHAARLGDRQRRSRAGGRASRGEAQAGRGLMLRRLPIESSQPILLFALSRVAIVVVGLTAMLVLSLPEEEARGGGGRRDRAVVVAAGARPDAARPAARHESARGDRRPGRPGCDRAGGARDVRRGALRRSLPDRRPRPFPGLASRVGGGSGGRGGARRRHRAARRRAARGRRARLLRGRLHHLRARQRDRGRPAAQRGVSQPAARPPPHAAHDPVREPRAPARGRCDPRRAGAGADRSGHDPVERPQGSGGRPWQRGGRADRRGPRS